MSDDFVAEWEAWREAREARLTSPHGFLAVTGLHWLTDEPQRFDDVPGAWSTTADGVVVDLAEGEELIVDGVALSGRHTIGPVDEEGVRASYDDAVVEVSSRGGAVMVRPRRPDNPLRAGPAPASVVRLMIVRLWRFAGSAAPSGVRVAPPSVDL